MNKDQQKRLGIVCTIIAVVAIYFVVTEHNEYRKKQRAKYVIEQLYKINK